MKIIVPLLFFSQQKAKAEIQSHVQELRNDYYILIHAVDDVEKGLKALQIQINPQLTFVCRLCGGITFTNEESYWAHMRNQHRS